MAIVVKGGHLEIEPDSDQYIDDVSVELHFRPESICLFMAEDTYHRATLTLDYDQAKDLAAALQPVASVLALGARMKDGYVTPAEIDHEIDRIGKIIRAQ